MSHLESNLPYYAARLVEAMRAVLQTDLYAEHRVVIHPVRLHSEAPSTLPELREAVANGVLPVSMQDSSTAIYGPRGNIVFRAFHDVGHVAYNYDMTHRQESLLAVRQWGDIYKLIPAGDRWWCNLLYHADTVGQTEYHRLAGKHVEDQLSFVLQVCSICEKGHQSVTQAVRQIVLGE